jgi:hypothetical protein
VPRVRPCGTLFHITPLADPEQDDDGQVRPSDARSDLVDVDRQQSPAATVVTSGTAAAAVACAPSAIVGLFACVVKIVAPFLFTSQMIAAPDGAVPTAARTEVIVPMFGHG